MYGFRNWKMSISFPETGTPGGGLSLREQSISHWGNPTFEVPVGHPSGDVKQAGGHTDPEFS